MLTTKLAKRPRERNEKRKRGGSNGVCKTPLLRRKSFYTSPKFFGKPIRQGIVRCGSRKLIRSNTSRASLWLDEKWDWGKHGEENWVGQKRGKQRKMTGKSRNRHETQI